MNGHDWPLHAGWTKMPQKEKIGLLLCVGPFHWTHDPVNPSSVAEKIITAGKHHSKTSNKHTMSESHLKRCLLKKSSFSDQTMSYQWSLWQSSFETKRSPSLGVEPYGVCVWWCAKCQVTHCQLKVLPQVSWHNLDQHSDCKCVKWCTSSNLVWITSQFKL